MTRYEIGSVFFEFHNLPPAIGENVVRLQGGALASYFAQGMVHHSVAYRGGDDFGLNPAGNSQYTGPLVNITGRELYVIPSQDNWSYVNTLRK